ncbi:MAG: DUF2752 domain-containing protein [Nocardioides sp.]|uniref:DUF2752 domain-containing protein n=1 Tax=Nocardioides sp. TaxID=35761 RepID=UPI003263FAC7
MSTVTKPGALVRISLERRGQHGLFTTLGVLALAIAAAMAIFGLPPVDLHSPMHKIGIMDPLCGGTRAARYAAQGNLAEAWRYNPLSILVVYGAGLTILRAVVGLLGRRWVTCTVSWTRGRRRWAITIVIVLVALLEIRQQLRADLLMADTLSWV